MTSRKSLPDVLGLGSTPLLTVTLIASQRIPGGLDQSELLLAGRMERILREYARSGELVNDA